MASHLIILSTGRRDGGKKATLAFNIGVGALAVGDDVTVYLAMDGVCWAFRQCSQGVSVAGDSPVTEYISQYLELGGKMLLCSRCADGLCEGPCPTDREMLSEIEYAGVATLAELADESTVYTF